MATYPLEVDDEMWEDWKATVPRTYARLGDRVGELVKADLKCQNEYGKGVIELLEEEGHIDIDEL